MTNNNSAAAGSPILGLLGIAFVVLKLVGVIGWSWWWVTAPFWGPLAIVVLILIVLGIAYGATWLYWRFTTSAEQREKDLRVEAARKSLDSYFGGRR